MTRGEQGGGRIVHFTPYSRRCLAGSLAMLRHGILDPSDREQAAAVIRFVAKYVAFDERLATDVMSALSEQLAAPDVVDNLLRALRRSPEPMKLTSGLERLAVRARREGHWPSFVRIVSMMQETPTWRGHVAEDVFVSTVEHAVSQGRWWIAATLIHHRLHELDTVPLGLGDVMEAHPRLLRQRPVTASQAWTLHQARPTPHGWNVLATTLTTRDSSLQPSLFGSELDTAIETLEAAVGSEPQGARRSTLARWLGELRGIS